MFGTAGTSWNKFYWVGRSDSVWHNVHKVEQVLLGSSDSVHKVEQVLLGR